MTTKADRARFDAFRRIGCVACGMEGAMYRAADVHHLLSGGRRRGHQYTVPLCEWHHRGVPNDGVTMKLETQLLGPSLALTPRKFRERYGTDEELLAYTNRLIGMPK